ncbi:MAG: type I-E CRISPR-associated protein Cse2/CasB [Pseudomonadota bacterium]
MMIKNTEKAGFARTAVQRWWQSMMLSPDEIEKIRKKLKLEYYQLYPAPSVYKAQLRRCATAEEAIFTEGFRALWSSLPKDYVNTKSKKQIQCWGTIAAALVYIKPEANELSDNLAIAAGRKSDRNDDKPQVSELRFARLVNAKNPEELLRRLRQNLKIVKGKVSPVQMAKDIECWFYDTQTSNHKPSSKRLQLRWAMEYYKVAPEKKQPTQ